MITISDPQINILINHDIIMAKRLSCQLEANLYSAFRETVKLQLELLVKTEKREYTYKYFGNQSMPHI